MRLLFTRRKKKEKKKKGKRGRSKTRKPNGHVVIYGNYINECIIYVIIQHTNVYFFVFFSNNVGSYDLQSDLTIYDPLTSHNPR